MNRNSLFKLSAASAAVCLVGFIATTAWSFLGHTATSPVPAPSLEQSSAPAFEPTRPTNGYAAPGMSATPAPGPASPPSATRLAPGASTRPPVNVDVDAAEVALRTYPARVLLPYPGAVIASEAKERSVNSQAFCMAHPISSYLFIDGASSDERVAVPSALSADGQAKHRKVLLKAGSSGYWLMLASEQASVWDISMEEGAFPLGVVFMGHPSQAVTGVPSTLPVLFSAHEALPAPAINRALCGFPPSGTPAEEVARALRTARRIEPVLAAQYPYPGSPLGQASDNTLPLLLSALKLKEPQNFAANFMASKGALVAASGWRAGTVRDLAEWNAQTRARATQSYEHFRPDLTGAVFLVSRGGPLKYLAVSEETSRRIVYMGASADMQGDSQASVVLDTTTFRCSHREDSPLCAMGQHE